MGSQQQSVQGCNCKGANIYMQKHWTLFCMLSWQCAHYTGIRKRDLCNRKKRFITYYMFMHCTALQCKSYCHIGHYCEPALIVWQTTTTHMDMQMCITVVFQLVLRQPLTCVHIEVCEHAIIQLSCVSIYSYMYVCI